ncbi:MAG: hypothetical protein QNM02_14720 [Acidimicrobiia bacterium]|nr:hypothetical protein [Acidimicrobiia bacterium]
MTEAPPPIGNPRLKTPAAAAVAGIIFSVLLGTSMLLIFISIPDDPTSDSSWLIDHRGRVNFALALIPFAAIAFLWFVGVVRDLMGPREDQFFATIFLGSGILLLGGLFVWMTIVAAVLANTSSDPEFANSSSYLLGASMIEVMGGTILVRMAGVFMFSSAVMWHRTRVVPAWLFIATYATSLVMLFGGAWLRPLRLVFPVWVLVTSIMILWERRRRAKTTDN